VPDPQEALAGIPELAGARIVRRLGAGQASESWLLESPGGRLVLRRDTGLARRLGLDRAAEFELLCALAGTGLAPEPVRFVPEHGALVMRYLEGEAWSPAELEGPERLRALGRLLRRLHDRPVAGKAFDPARIARHYARQASAPDSHILVGEVEMLADELYPEGMARHICHHDPHCGNLIGTDPPRLIDWEYAAAGDPLMDLAVVGRYHRLQGWQERVLLEAWSDGLADLELRERLKELGRLYDLLATLWERVVGGG